MVVQQAQSAVTPEAAWWSDLLCAPCSSAMQQQAVQRWAPFAGLSCRPSTFVGFKKAVQYKPNCKRWTVPGSFLQAVPTCIHAVCSAAAGSGTVDIPLCILANRPAAQM